MTKFIVSDMEYSREEAEALRNQIIALRDEALKQGDMQWSVILSHTVSLMHAMFEHIWGVSDMKGWTQERRQAYYEEKKSSYPFEVYTNGVEQPRPEVVKATSLYGDFVRVPFPERGETIWLFTSRDLAVMFQQDYKARM